MSMRPGLVPALWLLLEMWKLLLWRLWMRMHGLLRLLLPLPNLKE